MGLFTATWPIYYYFGALALAEAPSIFCLNVIIILLLDRIVDGNNIQIFKRAFLLSLLLAALFLLKANNILVAMPVALIFLFLSKCSFLSRFKYTIFMALTTFLLILPWFIFLKTSIGEWKITTTGGLNLLVGTGGQHHFGLKEDPTALHARYMASRLNEASRQLSTNELESLQSKSSSRAQIDNISKSIALRIWRQDTMGQIIYGALKVAHSFGGSLRGFKDYLTIIFFLTIGIATLFVCRHQKYRPYVALHLSCMLCGIFISFFFLPNIRFKTFYFDTTGLLILACAFEILFQKLQYRVASPR